MRFIIISVPPESLILKLRALQKLLSTETGSREALYYPPHITLRTGLVCPDEAAREAVQAFLDHASRLPAAFIRSTGAEASVYRDSAGTERGFLGYHVELSPELLALHRGLLAFKPWQKGLQGAFEPHVSLCYHDLNPAIAKVSLEKYRIQIETLSPAWDIQAVELWVPTEESWSFHSRAILQQD